MGSWHSRDHHGEDIVTRGNTAPTVSYHIVRRLIYTPFVALPNILANRAIVPELIQDEATPDALAAALLCEMRTGSDEAREAAFCRLHSELSRDASARAADAVLGLMDRCDG